MTSDRPKSPPVSGSAPGAGPSIREQLARLQEDPAALLEAFPTLSFPEQMNLFLLAPPELRLELLLGSSHPKKLVAGLSVQEAYMTLKEIGYPDAAPLLANMTLEQVHYWTDLDTWEKDDFHPETLLRFLELMHACGQDKLAAWVAMIDPEALVLTLCACGMVTKFDIFKDPMDEDDLPPFETYDGYYRYHILDERVRPHVAMLLRILHTQDPERYGMIMESAYQDTPVEVQEEALRFRNARLADLGVPAFEEALEIYRPLSLDAFHEIVQALPAAREKQESGSVVFPVRWLPPDGLLRRSLRSLAGRREADALRLELAALGNRVVVADGMDAGNPDFMKAALRKVASYVTIGLERLGSLDERSAASRILKTRLILLFRLGYGQVHRLQDAARHLLDRTRFRWAGQAMALAGTPFEQTLWGVSRPRPLFFEGIHADNFLGFREFEGTQDIRITEDRLSAVSVLADFFIRRDLSPESIKTLCLEAGWGDRMDLVGWPSVLQTLWVNRLLLGSESFRLLLPHEVQQFSQRFLQAGPDGGPRRLDPAYTRDLVLWMEREAPGAPPPVQQILAEWIRAGTCRLEQDLGGLHPETAPDPRFVQALCMRLPPHGEA